jgi:hypothetical protein
MQKESKFATSANPAAQLQNFDMASWLAGKASGSDDASRSSSRRN